MIGNYEEFKARMKSGKEKDIESLILTQKSRPYTFGEWQRRYEKEKREAEQIRKGR